MSAPHTPARKTMSERVSGDFSAAQSRRISGNFSNTLQRSGRSSLGTPLRLQPGTPGARPGRISMPIPGEPEDIESWLQEIQTKGRKISEDAAWNNRLIDYFEMTKFTENGSINYARAATYLGGSVALYRSRVELLKKETNRAVSRMIRATPKGDAEAGEDEDDTQGLDADQSFVVDKKIRPKRAANAKPLFASSSRKLKMSLASLVNTTDPLFRKTQIDFDKGGYKALLLASTTPDFRGRLSFEDVPAHASSRNVPTDASENDQFQEEGVETAGSVNSIIVGEGEYLEIDLEDVADKFNEMDDLAICPLLEEIRARVNDPHGSSNLEIDDHSMSMIADELSHHQQPGDDEFGDMYMEDMDMNYGGDGIDLEENESRLPSPDYTAEEFNSMVSQLDYLASANWKYERLRLFRRENDPKQAPKKALKRAYAAIDFEGEDLDVSKIFTKEQPGRLNLNTQSLQLQALTLESIEARNFMRLRIKPNFIPQAMVEAVRRVQEQQQPRHELKGSDKVKGPRNYSFEEETDVSTNDDIASQAILNLSQDETFMSQAAQADEPKDLDMEDPFNPFDQFDDNGYDDDNDDSLHPPEKTNGAAAANELLREKRPLKVLQRNVDIRRLKDNMWSQIEDKQEEFTMTEIIRETNSMYTKREKMDLVAPLYFLNLLHLANERGIALANVEGFKDIEIHTV